MADKRNLFYAAIPMGYGELELDRHQVFPLSGQPNDDRLISLRYMQPLEKADEVHECSECGAKFVTHAARITHHRRAHESRSESQVDSDIDRDEKLNAAAGVGVKG